MNYLTKYTLNYEDRMQDWDYDGKNCENHLQLLSFGLQVMLRKLLPKSQAKCKLKKYNFRSNVEDTIFNLKKSQEVSVEEHTFKKKPRRHDLQPCP